MAAVTASMVKELRERTGLGMMECKKALVGAEGDIERAIDDLRYELNRAVTQREWHRKPAEN